MSGVQVLATIKIQTHDLSGLVFSPIASPSATIIALRHFSYRRWTRRVFRRSARKPSTKPSTTPASRPSGSSQAGVRRSATEPCCRSWRSRKISLSRRTVPGGAPQDFKAAVEVQGTRPLARCRAHERASLAPSYALGMRGPGIAPMLRTKSGRKRLLRILPRRNEAKTAVAANCARERCHDGERSTRFRRGRASVPSVDAGW